MSGTPGSLSQDYQPLCATTPSCMSSLNTTCYQQCGPCQRMFNVIPVRSLLLIGLLHYVSPVAPLTPRPPPRRASVVITVSPDIFLSRAAFNSPRVCYAWPSSGLFAPASSRFFRRARETAWQVVEPQRQAGRVAGAQPVLHKTCLNVFFT